MDEKRDELLVRKFFEENKIEIPDAGFSRRVMRCLPDRTRRLNRIWTAICVAVGVVMCVKFDWLSSLSAQVKSLADTVMSNHVISENPILLLFGLLFVIFLGGYNLIMAER